MNTPLRPACHAAHHVAEHGGGSAIATSPPRGELRDPVCGMTVSPESPHRADHAGRDHYFCSAHCRTRFVARR